MATKKACKKECACAELAINGGKKVWTKGFPAWPQFDKKTDKKVLDILHSGKVNYWTGPVGMQFEAAWAKWLGVKNAVSVSNGTAALHEADLSKPTVLIVGNETFGMSKAWKEACDLLLRIPIYGAASSLNVGSAASICLYEIARQRDFDGHR